MQMLQQTGRDPAGEPDGPTIDVTRSEVRSTLHISADGRDPGDGDCGFAELVAGAVAAARGDPAISRWIAANSAVAEIHATIAAARGELGDAEAHHRAADESNDLQAVLAAAKECRELRTRLAALHEDSAMATAIAERLTRGAWNRIVEISMHAEHEHRSKLASTVAETTAASDSASAALADAIRQLPELQSAMEAASMALLSDRARSMFDDPSTDLHYAITTTFNIRRP